MYGIEYEMLTVDRKKPNMNEGHGWMCFAAHMTGGSRASNSTLTARNGMALLSRATDITVKERK
jgi:hypothetical protein